MIKMLLIFVITCIVIYIGIEIIRAMSSLEKWALTKTAAYAVSIAAIATVLLSLIVFLF